MRARGEGGRRRVVVSRVYVCVCVSCGQKGTLGNVTWHRMEIEKGRGWNQEQQRFCLFPLFWCMEGSWDDAAAAACVCARARVPGVSKRATMVLGEEG